MNIKTALHSLIPRGPPARAVLNAYIKINTTQAFCLIALALTGLFSLLELVEQLAQVGQGQYHVSTALLFVVLTIPGRLLQVAPVSMLFGSLLSLSALARTSELTAMQSLGVAQASIVRPVLELAIPIVAVLFLIAQFAVPPSQLLANRLRSDALASAASPQPTNSLWAASDGQYLNVQRFTPGNKPVGIDIYSFHPDGSLDSLIHADRGKAASDGTWLLSNVSLKHVVAWQVQTDHIDDLLWKSFISPKQMRFLSLPLDSVPPIELFGHLRALRRIHVRAPRFEHEFWAKVSIPVSMIAMILATSRLVFGPARMHSIAGDLSWGVGFGLAFSLGQQILGSLGILLNMPAAICALTLPLLVIGTAVLSLYPSAWRSWISSPAAPKRVRA